jgi:UBX domain-containing protein 7
MDMDDEAVIQFTAITSASPEQATRYLHLTDGNLEQAVQLFFEHPGLAVEQTSPAAASVPHEPPPTAQDSHVPHHSNEPITIDSDDDSDIEMLDERPVGPDTSDDAEMARRLQEEMYHASGAESEQVRAPMTRTRETLVGGPDFEDMDDTDVSTLIQQQLLNRQRRPNGSKSG